MKTIDPNDTTKEFFNITKYLLNCYDKNIQPDPVFMENIDFNEISQLFVSYFSQKTNQTISYTVHETLAQNCIANLPLNAYKKFLTADWLEFSKDDTIILKSVIFKKNIDLLEEIHDIGIEKTKKDNNFSNVFFRCFYEPLFDVKHTFESINKTSGFSQDFVNRYHKLLIKSYSEIKYFQDLYFPKKNTKEIKYSKESDWLNFTLSSSGNYNDSFECKCNNILDSLVQQKEFMPIFEDAVQQIIKKISDPKNIKTLNKNSLSTVFGLKNETSRVTLNNIISSSIASSNFEALELIIQTVGATHQDILNAFDKNIESAFFNAKNYSGREFSSVKNLLTFNYFEFKNKFFPELDSKHSPLFILSSNQDCRNHIIQNKDLFFYKNIFNDYSMHDIISIAKLFKTYTDTSKDNGFKIDFSFKNTNVNSFMFVSDYIAKNDNLLLNLIEFKDFNEEQWNNLYIKFKTTHKFISKIKDDSKVEINENELTIFFNQFKLNNQLVPQDFKLKSKIKV